MNDSVNISDALETQVYPILGVEGIYKGCTFKSRDDERWRGAGPFRESTSGTSFVVNPHSFVWWDEGLRAGGGPLQFRHRLGGGNGAVRGQDFITVAQELFNEAGLPFPQKELSPVEALRMREREHRAFVVETLSKVCAAILWTAAGEVARDYLHDRGLTDDAITMLGLGLYHDHTEIRESLEAAGVALPETRGIDGQQPRHDLAWLSLKQLEGYITFPWLDAQGRGLTIYGRWPRVPPAEKPKTWALGGTGSKRSPFYFDRARAAGIKHVRLVEGVVDAAVARASGDASVTACVAASLSKEQGATLARHGIEAVTICLDPDSAGENGTPSCIKTLEPYQIDVYVAPKLPDGLDPDEFIIQRGIEAWHQHCQQADHSYRWIAKQILALPSGDTWTDLNIQQACHKAHAFARSITISHRKPDLENFFWPTIRATLGLPTPAPGPAPNGKAATSKERKTPPQPIVMNLAEVLAQKVDAPSMLIENLIPEFGATLMSGPPKSNKTLLAVQMAVAVASGRAFIDTHTVFSKGAVLVVEQDDPGGGASIKDVLQKSKVPDGIPFHLTVRIPFSFGLSFLEWLEREITTKALKLVVLDSYTALRGPRSGGIDIVKAEHADMTALDELGKRTRCAILLIHHDSKGSKGLEWTDLASGSFAMTGATEALIHVCRFPELDSTAQERLIQARGRHDKGIQAVVRFREDSLDHEHILSGGAAPLFPLLLQLQSALGTTAFSPKGITQETGVSRATAHRQIDRLYRAGAIRKQGYGEYVLVVKL